MGAGWKKFWGHYRAYRRIYNLKLARNFGFRFYWRSITNRVWWRLTKKQKYYDRLWNLNSAMLLKNYGSVLTNTTSGETLPPNFPVWVCWWQGLDHAPELIQACVQSIQQHFPGHPVTVITQDNYADYVTIPPEIMAKFQKNIITITHFSDLLRMALIAEHGGAWLDATIFVREPLAENLVGREFYTAKKDGRRWTAFFLAGGKGNAVAVNVRDLLFAYWRDHTVQSDYFLVDLALDLAQKQVPAVAQLLDAVPPNNPEIFTLQAHLAEPRPAVAPDWFTANQLFKLTHKTNLPRTPGSWLDWLLTQYSSTSANQ